MRGTRIASLVAVLLWSACGNDGGSDTDPPATCCAIQRMCAECTCDASTTRIGDSNDGEACEATLAEGARGCDFYDTTQGLAVCASGTEPAVGSCGTSSYCLDDMEEEPCFELGGMWDTTGSRTCLDRGYARNCGCVGTGCRHGVRAYPDSSCPTID